MHLIHLGESGQTGANLNHPIQPIFVLQPSFLCTDGLSEQDSAPCAEVTRLSLDELRAGGPTLPHGN